MTSASRPSLREITAVLSLLVGCAVVIVELLRASTSLPLAIAVGVVVVLTVSGGLTTWWRARPQPVANHILGLLLAAVTGFLGVMFAVGAVS